MSGVTRFDVVQGRLGLGCARLGSVLGRDRAEASRLIQSAFDRGIRFFDTANIYGQGGSERILGAALHGRREQVMIVTKAGQHFPPWMQVAKPFKQVVRPLIQRNRGGQQMVSKLRAAPLPQNFSDRSLRASIEGSLRRLNTDYADILLLHSPPAEVIANGEALGSLEKIRAAGKTIRIGISCEDAGSGLLALDDRRVETVELPLWPATDTTERFLERARHQGVFVIGRGVMSAASQGQNNDRWPAARAALVHSLSRRGIDRILIGTTRIVHLVEVLDAVESTENALCL
jgi:aryl-alcohol dehydrogenase-like predicted oxidoreductase